VAALHQVSWPDTSDRKSVVVAHRLGLALGPAATNGLPFGPVHLLLLDHSLTYQVIDSRLHERRRDRFVVAIAIPRSRGEGLVGGNVGSEFPNRLEQFLSLGTNRVIGEQHSQAADEFQRLVHVAVPQVPLNALEILLDLFHQRLPSRRLSGLSVVAPLRSTAWSHETSPAEVPIAGSTTFAACVPYRPRR
jgi:hypothetical protein